MVSGLFSANTVAHFCPAAATSSCGPAAAGCAETLNTSMTALIQRRACIMSSLILAQHFTDADVNCSDFLNCWELWVPSRFIAGACAAARGDLTCAFRNAR